MSEDKSLLHNGLNLYNHIIEDHFIDDDLQNKPCFEVVLENKRDIAVIDHITDHSLPSSSSVSGPYSPSSSSLTLSTASSCHSSPPSSPPVPSPDDRKTPPEASIAVVADPALMRVSLTQLMDAIEMVLKPLLDTVANIKVTSENQAKLNARQRRTLRRARDRTIKALVSLLSGADEKSLLHDHDVYQMNHAN
eukprot:CAMPEP_0175075966 /NCGR_PEP_ID=MMETSP0052_2-20121109/22399_1 /TAXON_ID=51329 ORGANISM="Polytomella parva, Strain SAG 63-3" /NCGR_SAMPLE_ID=MMETSP0052_2 /ASSEMBLY_ACC=CAM_ASM_000194 /LENGTH=192 /DNA_ID=CAMNT_0016344921 /DNA_START=317 /DNA_END=892 /DNA_ORIENTATION=+